MQALLNGVIIGVDIVLFPTQCHTTGRTSVKSQSNTNTFIQENGSENTVFPGGDGLTMLQDDNVD